MWKLYLKSDEGIAIRSTYNKLEASLKNATEDIYIGTVKYINYATDFMPEGNIFNLFTHKRLSFAHEQELRAIIHHSPLSDDTNSLDFSKDTIVGGINAKVDLESLLDSIYLAPNSPKWIQELTEAILRRYNLDAPVIQSALDEDPVY